MQNGLGSNRSRDAGGNSIRQTVHTHRAGLAVPPNEFFEQHEIMNGCRRIYVYCFLGKKLID